MSRGRTAYDPAQEAPITHDQPKRARDIRLPGRVVQTDPPGTWRVGRLLDTPANRMMAPQDRAYHEDIESRSVYEGFTVEDAGRGRRHIATYDTPAEAQRVVRHHNRELAKFTIPRAVAFMSGPIGPNARQWTLAFGWRPDLAKQFEIVPARFALEVTRRRPFRDRFVTRDGVTVERGSLAGGWRIRVRSDFDLIEQRIQYRAIGRHLVNRLVKGNVTRWTLAAEEERLERLAWRTGSAVQAQVALRGVEAIRGVMAERGLPDRWGRLDRRGFFA